MINIARDLAIIERNHDNSPETWAGIEKKFADYQKDFGASHMMAHNVALLRLSELHAAKKVLDQNKFQALLQRLEADPLPEVAELTKWAEIRIGESDWGQRETSKLMSDLKGKPIDLKFTAIDGTEVDLAKLRGKVVLLYFWATWCQPSYEGLPNVMATYKKFHDQGFEVVGISLDQNKDDLLKFTKENGMTWPQYFDGQGWSNKISTRFDVHFIPTMWLLDQKGVLVTVDGGDNLEGQVGKLLEAGRTAQSP